MAELPYDPNDPNLIQNVDYVTSTGRTYLQNLELAEPESQIDTFVSDPTQHLAFQALANDAGISTSSFENLNAFFDSFNALEGNPLPNTWESFLKAYTDFYGLPQYSDPYNNTPYNEFKRIFTRLSGLDFELIGAYGLVDSNNVDLDRQFQAAFASFLRNFPYGSDGKIETLDGATGENSTILFLKTYEKFLHPITSIQSDPLVATLGSSTSTSFTADGISDYAAIYTFFGLEITSEAFAKELKDYYAETVNRFGYFHLGQAFDGWITRLWDKFKASRPTSTNTLNIGDQVVQSTVTSVSSEHSKRVIILDRIFRLLAEIIGSLQSVAAAQAEQINFLSQWQRAFTDMIADVQTFQRNDGTIFGISYNPDNLTDLQQSVQEEMTTARGDVNTEQTNRREVLSAWRGIVQDTAKREQTRVNQSQDAVSQQANIATAIIQQLTTILGSIFR